MKEKECNWEACKLEYYLPEEFVQFVWQTEGRITLLFVTFERILSFYVWAMAVAWITLACQDDYFKCLIFFDYWALVFSQLVPEILLRFSVLKRYTNDFDDHYWDFMPWYLKIRWAFFNVALPSTILACIAYWSQTYPKVSHPFCMLMNIASPLLLICQVLILAFPLRFLHFYFFVIFYLVYIIFTVIYQSSGGTGVRGSIPIYDLLDWRYPSKAILAASLGLVIGLAVHFLFCFVSLGKIYIREKYMFD